MIAISKRERLVASIKRISAAVKKAVAAASASSFKFNLVGSMTKTASYASSGNILISLWINPAPSSYNATIFGMQSHSSYKWFRAWLNSAGTTLYFTEYGSATKEMSVAVTPGQWNNALIWIPKDTTVNSGYCSIAVKNGATTAQIFNNGSLNLALSQVVVGNWTLGWGNNHGLDSFIGNIAVYLNPSVNPSVDGNSIVNDFDQFVTADGNPRTDLDANKFGKPTFWIKGDAAHCNTEYGTDTNGNYTLTGGAFDVAPSIDTSIDTSIAPKGFKFDANSLMRKTYSKTGVTTILASLFVNTSASSSDARYIGIKSATSGHSIDIWQQPAANYIYITINGTYPRYIRTPVTPGQWDHVLIFITTDSSVNGGNCSIVTNSGQEVAGGTTFPIGTLDLSNADVVSGTWMSDMTDVHALNSGMSNVAVWLNPSVLPMFDPFNGAINDFSSFTYGIKPRTDLDKTKYGKPTFWIRGEAASMGTDSGTDTTAYTVTGTATDVAI